MVINFSIYWKVEDKENSSQISKTNLAPLLNVKWIFRFALHDNELVQKITECKFMKIVLIYYLQKWSYLPYVFEKKIILHSGTLMKYLEDLTQK